MKPVDPVMRTRDKWADICGGLECNCRESREYREGYIRVDLMEGMPTNEDLQNWNALIGGHKPSDLF